MPRTKKKKEEKKSASAKAAADKEEEPKKKRVRHSYLYAVGRRKKSIARARLFKSGKGEIKINQKDYTQYFPSLELQQMIKQPLEAIGKLKDFNFSIKVEGGGFRGQAEACRLGITRALVIFDKELRKTLKPLGFLRRDPRRKERKKPGLKGARRAPQWQKR